MPGMTSTPREAPASSASVTPEMLRDWARMMDVEFVHITKDTTPEKLEEELQTLLPDARILRMDRDSTSRKDSHDDLLTRFRTGEADILVGTQMIAKGLDFPNVTLVGVLNADQSLNIPDFRAEERTFQLLAQVAGRAGRAAKPGEVFFQTFDPSARAIRAAANEGNFPQFANDELRLREERRFAKQQRIAGRLVGCLPSLQFA